MATNTRKLAALLGASGANIADAGTINTAGITNDAINADKIVANAVGTSEVADNVLTATDLAANSVGSSELDADTRAGKVITTEVQPHIIPGVLYPAVDGKGIDGTTTITSFGTDVTISGFPTLKYYYTNIKGSKPIKDPRVGAHFGSQRHKLKSLQILDQETATHGSKVYSVDGREWIRCVSGSNGWNARNDGQGTCIEVNRGNLDGTDFMEITGYFNFANISVFTNSDHQNQTSIFLNGTDTTNDLDPETSVVTPLENRFVDPGALIPVNLGTVNTPGINTLKLTVSDSTTDNIYALFYAIDLIAQDISSTANRPKIQIHAQNVVSAGKKFSISATADHYDPFSAKTDGSAWTSPTSGNNTANSAASWPTNIDTTHSLGLENWVNGSSYYRPYNGGRVVKYVDSTGTIKTAVTVMPPNARSIADAANLSGGEEKGDDSAGNTSAAAANDTYKPTFTDQTIATAEDLYETAKTFHWREFGNGAANSGGGDGKGGNADETWPDCSMLAGSDDISFCMDDGLTTISGKGISGNNNTTYGNFIDHGNNDVWYLTFIGTGISTKTMVWDQNADVFLNHAQNLHYGTHVYKVERDGSGGMTYTLDGVVLRSGNNLAGKDLIEVTFYQPKKPPIPEDVVVLADYMLMADFVPISAQAIGNISKGVREQNPSRDVFYDGSGYGGIGLTSVTANHSGFYHAGHSGTPGSVTSNPQRIPSFGTNIVHRGHASPSKAQIYIDSTSQTTTDDSTNNGYGSYQYIATNKDLGAYNWGINATTVAYAGNTTSFEIVTPIHTSHHYTHFETPFLHELVGGDRNMEQTHLICTSDGKTWDEITRDTSYISKDLCVQTTTDTAFGSDVAIIWDEWRGSQSAHPTRFVFNKRWAIAYDQMICLETGMYEIRAQAISESNAAGGTMAVYHNANNIQQAHFGNGGSHETTANRISVNCQRGDTIQIRGILHANDHYNNFTIKKLQ